MLYDNPFTGDLEFISGDDDYCIVFAEEEWEFPEV